jgi:hypothetical protein
LSHFQDTHPSAEINDRLRLLLERLGGAERSGSGWQARCPAHEDNRPSLTVGVGDGGKVLLKCHRGCTAEEVVKALGLGMSDLFPPQNGQAKFGRVAGIYDYCDEQGRLLFQTVRMVPKDFRQRRPDGKGGFVWKLDGVRRVPYRLPELLAAPAGSTVYILEGEKDADRLAKLGLSATTNPCGAGQWKKLDVPTVEKALGGKRVVVIADNDDAGRKHARDVAQRLQGVAADVRVLELPGVPEKGDVSDWLDAGGTPERLPELVEAAASLSPDPHGLASNGGASPPAAEEEAVAYQEPPWPHPMALEAFRGLAGEFVRAVEPHSEADRGALLIQFLAAFGNLVGRGAYFRVEGTRHHPNEFAVLVGETSKARKGTSWGRVGWVAERLDAAWAAERIGSGLSSGEGLIWEVRDPVVARQAVKAKGRVTGYETVETDPGVADKRLLVVEPEFANVLKQTERTGNTLSVALRQAWDGLTLRSMTKNSPARATDAHVSAIGHITVEELRRYLTATESANGFGNRFIWLCVRRSKLLPDGGEPPVGVLEAICARAARVLEAATQAGEVRRDPEASAVWRAVYGALSEGGPGLTGAMLGRGEAHVMRLAMIYALLDGSVLIRPEHLEAALSVWDYSMASVRHIFGDLTGDDLADDLLRLLRATPDGLTRNDLMNYLGRNVPSGRIGRALGLLLRYKLILERKEETGGRPATRYTASR